MKYFFSKIVRAHLEFKSSGYIFSPKQMIFRIIMATGTKIVLSKTLNSIEVVILEQINTSNTTGSTFIHIYGA